MRAFLLLIFTVGLLENPPIYGDEIADRPSLRASPTEKLSVNLEEAERLALEQNKQILMVKSLLDRAEQGRLEAYSKWMPELQVQSQAFRSQSDQSFTNTKSTFLTQLSLTQQIFSADVFYGIKLATLNVTHLHLLLESAVNDILYQTRLAYYKVALDYQNLATRREHVELMSSLSKRMEDNFQRGTATIYNVNQSKVFAANATTKYYQARKMLKTDLDILAQLLGYDPGSIDLNIAEGKIPVREIPDIASKITKLEEIFKLPSLTDLIYRQNFPGSEGHLMRALFSLEEVEKWEQIALSARPALRDKRNTVKIADEQVKEKQGEYYPSVNMLVGYGGFQTPYNFVPSDHFLGNMQWSVGVQLNWMIFDSLGRERRIKQARSKRKADTFSLQKEVQETLVEVRTQIYGIEESVASYTTASGNVRLAHQTVRQTQDQLDIGYATIFDYQIAVDSLIEAENTQNQSRYDLIEAYYSLRHASGIDMMEKNTHE